MECTHPRDCWEAEPTCGIQDNERIGLVLNVVVTRVYGLYSIEVQVPSRQCSWAVISPQQECHTNTGYDWDGWWWWRQQTYFRSRKTLRPRPTCGKRFGVSANTSKATPPTSRSAITKLSRVSRESTPRAQGDLVRSSEICQVITPPTRPGQRYIGMNHRKWIAVSACERVDNCEHMCAF